MTLSVVERDLKKHILRKEPKEFPRRTVCGRDIRYEQEKEGAECNACKLTLRSPRYRDYGVTRGKEICD